MELFQYLWIYSNMFYQGYRFHLALPNVQFLKEILNKYLNLIIISFFSITGTNKLLFYEIFLQAVFQFGLFHQIDNFIFKFNSVFATSIIMPFISRVILNKKFKSQETLSHFIISVGIYVGGFLMFIGLCSLIH